MPAVNRFDLKLGDILMTKHQGGVTHNVISFGSFLSGNFGTAGYVHAQIVCKMGARQELSPEIAESHAGGLQIEAPYSPATVFRLKGSAGKLTPVFAKACAERAAEVAVELNGRQKPNDSFAQYAYGKALTSLFTRVTVNRSVVDQIKAIDEGTSHDRLFCSMFVVVCYQVAVLRMMRAGLAPPARLLPFDLDASAMEPAYMVSYMRRNADQWEEVGDFPGGHD